MTQMQPSQLKALIHLISQETGPQAHILREELARVMKQQPQALYEVIEKDFHSTIPASLVKAMQEVYWEELSEEIQLFAAKINPDIEEALILTTRFVNPAINRQEVTEYIDDLCRSLRPVLANCNLTEDIVLTMTRFLLHTQSFTVLPSAHDIKETSFGRFLRKKQGSILCMCSLYTVCGQRFGLDNSIVDLAGRLLVRITSQDNKIPLFLDPLNPERLLTLLDCQEYIFTRNLEWNEGFVAPLSSRDILRRCLGNMIFILNKLHDERRLSYLRRYMDILRD